MEPDQLLPVTKPGGRGPRPYDMETYAGIDRVVRNNLVYIGNIRALRAWYRFARRVSMTGDPYREACLEGAADLFESVLQERITRLDQFAEKVTTSVELLGKKAESGIETPGLAEQQEFLERWPEMKARLESGPEEDVGGADRTAFLEAWDDVVAGQTHLEAVAALDDNTLGHAAAWLQAIVDATGEIHK